MATRSPLLLHAAPDARLIERARAGDAAAFAALVTRYRRPLVRYCARLVPRDRAEDVVQEAFTNAYLSIDRRSGEIDNVRAWLYRIAHNTAMSTLRRGSLPQEPLREEHAMGEAPGDALERAERLHATVAQIRDLPDQQRTALLWHALEGRTYQSIAAQLMITPGAAHQLVHRARIRLRAGVSVLTPPAPLARLIELVRRAFESVPGGGRVIAATGAAVLAATAGVVATLPPADSAGAPRHRPPAAVHDVWAPAAPSPLSSVVIERRLRDPVHARPRHRTRRSPDRRPHRVAGASPGRPASSRATTVTAAAASPPATPASNEPSASSVPTAPATSASSSPSREEDAAHNKESSPAPAPAPAPAPTPDAGDSGDGDGG